MLDLIENNTTLPAHSLFFGPSMKLKVFINQYVSPYMGKVDNRGE